MSFKKPFRAVPVRPGPHYRRQQAHMARQRDVRTVLRYLALAAIAGALIGTASLMLDEGGRNQALTMLKPAAVALEWARARSPQLGDSWAGCNDARAAGTAPIYRNEPGYAPEMDGDGDGIACEPYHGD